MNKDQAEAVGLQALGFLASREDLFGGFLGATGASTADVRDQAQDPAFLGAVLDYLLQDDAWILSFAEETGLAPSILAQARQALPGGQITHWT